MPTSPRPARGLATARRLLGGLALAAICVAPLEGQQRKYLFEVGAAGSVTSFDDETDLGGAAGGVLRAGVWLPLNLSVEGEAAFASPKAQTADIGVSVSTLSASVLYNIPVGNASSVYLKVGGGSTSYGDCPTIGGPGAPICGSSGALIGGAGFRVAVSPSIMIRGEGTYNRNQSESGTPARSVRLSNYGVSLGVSLMLGNKPAPNADRDRDGVLDSRDACLDTPPGAQVDGRGCTADLDRDGVIDGADRCPGTPFGATVDPTGCPKDSDSDNILDGLDRCPDTRAGVLVDPRGCPRDSDEDAIPDGLDRCSDTPKGATVDALGCPGDEDGDGVLDGLDRCPRTPAGATVDAAGCAAGQQQTRPAGGAGQPGGAAPPAQPSDQPAQRGAAPPTPPAAARPDTAARPNAAARPPTGQPRPTPGRKPAGTITEISTVLPGVSFAPGTARLLPGSYIVLDSVAQILLADTTVHVEISGHTDNAGSPAENLHLSTLQAETVRTHLVLKGISVRRIIARGYGATVPLTPDTTPAGRARNRRIEIRRITPEL